MNRSSKGDGNIEEPEGGCDDRRSAGREDGDKNQVRLTKACTTAPVAPSLWRTNVGFKRIIHAVETHSGEPMRVITGGVPNIPGNTVYEQMKWLQQNDDQIRLLMLREPRGYPAVCCNLIVPPKHPDALAGYII